jgi:hypothetical protein
MQFPLPNITRKGMVVDTGVDFRQFNVLPQLALNESMTFSKDGNMPANGELGMGECSRSYTQAGFAVVVCCCVMLCTVTLLVRACSGAGSLVRIGNHAALITYRGFPAEPTKLNHSTQDAAALLKECVRAI